MGKLDPAPRFRSALTKKIPDECDCGGSFPLAIFCFARPARKQFSASFLDMAGIKRKEAPALASRSKGGHKKSKSETSSKKFAEKPNKARKQNLDAEAETDSDPIVESDTTEHSGDDDGVSWPSDDEGGVPIQQALKNPPERTGAAQNGKISVYTETNGGYAHT